MRYPVQGYRNAAAKQAAGRGFQQSRPTTAQPKTPTNDNVPSRSAKMLQFPNMHRKLALTALSGLAKLHPVGRALSLLVDAYRLYQQFNSANDENLGTFRAFNWTLAIQCPKPADLGNNSYTTACQINQSLTAASFYMHGVFIGTRLHYGVWWRNNYPLAVRYDLSQHWTRPTADGNPTAGTFLRPLFPPWWREGTQPAQLPYPFLDPFSMPVSTPMRPNVPAVPWTLQPYRRPNPFRSPVEQSHRGYSVPAYYGLAQPTLYPDPVTPVIAKPAQEVYPRVGVQIAPEHQYARPGPLVKEVKVKLSIAGSSIPGKIINVVTETFDVVSAIYDALPEHIRRRERAKRHGKKPSPQQKAMLIYRYYDQLDMVEAGKNLALNEAQDRFFGAVGKRVAKINRYAGFSRGLGGGPVNITGVKRNAFQ